MNTVASRALPREQWIPTLLQAGVWLVFLISPAYATVGSGSPLWACALGVASLVLFVVVYLTSFIVPRPFLQSDLWVNTAFYTAVLVLATGGVWVGASYYALTTCPYVAALWLFTHDLRTGIRAMAGVLCALALGLFSAAPREAWLALGGSVAGSIVMIAGIRFAVEQEESSRVLKERLTLAEQREGWARDVHDILGHSLTVIAVKAELASRLLDSDPERARGELADVLDLTRGSLAEVRSTVSQLRAPDLASQILASRTACESAGIVFHGPNPLAAEDVPEPQRSLFAWCLRESVTNVVRHARARECTVLLKPTKLEVIDDGSGHSGGEGTGIRGMRERCAAINAIFAVEKIHGDHGGTKVTVAVQ